MLKKWNVSLSLLAALSLLSPLHAAAADAKWPAKSVEVVVTASAGGDTDFNARAIAKYFKQITGVPMVVTNMPGGGGSIATSNVKDAKPDGTKALFCHTGQLIINEVTGLINYNFNDFDVTCIPAVNDSYVFVTSKKSGITSVKSLLEKAKANPNKVIYGTELGGYTHLQGLRLEKEADVNFKIVDTGSTSEKVVALLAGRVDIAAVSYGSVQDYKDSGELVIIAQGGAKRNPLIGDVPTLTESGVPMIMEIPYVISFPKGTDPAAVKGMAEVMEKIVALPAYAKDIETGYKQQVNWYNTEKAIEYLSTARSDFMQYKELLKK